MHFVMTLFGILNVNKPAGLTSRDVVDRVERLVRPAKAGHAGTLDPLATGVLVICVGQATRLIQYVQRMPKSIGPRFCSASAAKPTIWKAKLVPVVDAAEPTREALDRVLPQFLGDIQQRPPAHSAIKIAGRRAYELARRGVEVELAAADRHDPQDRGAAVRVSGAWSWTSNAAAARTSARSAAISARRWAPAP